MIDALTRLQNEKITLEEATIPIGGDRFFWHSSLIDKNGFPVAGGFGRNKIISRKIAVAEFLERKSYEMAANDELLNKKWKIDLVPTACGFAAGFNRENTVLRSFAEAHERWVMSKWIDENYEIEELSEGSIQAELSEASRFFIKNFDKVLFFKKSLMVQFGSRWIPISIGQTMGLKGQGIFPGSSAQKAGGDLWQHSLLESFRHLQAVKNNPDRGDVFPDNKVRFFASNADIALEQIYSPKKRSWPNPKVIFHLCEHKSHGDYFIARTIVDGWKSWKHGSIRRFLY